MRRILRPNFTDKGGEQQDSELGSLNRRACVIGKSEQLIREWYETM